MEEKAGVLEDRRQETMKMAVGGGGGYRKRAVTTEFDCCLCYAILESVTASTDGVGVGGERGGEPTSR